VSVNKGRVQTGLFTFIDGRFLIQVGNLKIWISPEKELCILTLFLIELGVALHRNDNLELATSHSLKFAFQLLGIATEHLHDLWIFIANELTELLRKNPSTQLSQGNLEASSAVVVENFDCD
jgi:hypothetical protein